MELRPFQETLIGKTRTHIRQRVRRILIQLATGGGKTVIAAFMIQGARARGLRVWFVVHCKELPKQTSATFRGMGSSTGSSPPIGRRMATNWYSCAASTRWRCGWTG